MNGHRADLEQALDAVAVRRSGSVTWFGRSVTRAPARSFPPGLVHAYAVCALERVLYESFYCLGAATPQRRRREPPATDRDFVAALSAANTGAGSWAHGWRIAGRSDTGVLVRGHGLRLLVRRAQTRLGTEAARIGAPVQVRLPKERLYASPGYYTALGDTDLGTEGDRRRIRLYFHVAASGAQSLVARLTSSLNAAGVAFRLKILDAPEAYVRCDAAVLCIAAADFEVIRPVLRALSSPAGVPLHARTPAFTKVLAAGIGLAEQPASGESFGTDRCRLLAEALVEARDHQVHERMAIVEESLASRGIDVDAPYLGSRSSDPYTMEVVGRFH